MGYMGSNKGATGPVCNTAQGAADAFLERYPTHRVVTVSLVKEGPVPGLVTVDYSAMRHSFVRAKGRAENAVN